MSHLRFSDYVKRKDESLALGLGIAAGTAGLLAFVQHIMGKQAKSQREYVASLNWWDDFENAVVNHGVNSPEVKKLMQSVNPSLEGVARAYLQQKV
jgi:hypothetical protein